MSRYQCRPGEAKKARIDGFWHGTTPAFERDPVMSESSNLMSDETARTVLAGTYRIVSPIAEGGCGEVHAADHTRLPGKFAVKLLHRSDLDNPDAQARFRQEAEITSTLRHPNIVQIVDFNVTEGGRPFLVMELIEGESFSPSG